ncbi:MAG: sulfatase [Prolixibacteraceae bacterium]
MTTKRLLKQIGSCALVLASSQVMAETAAPKKMNIVFILADDLGWADCDLNVKSRLYETPNLTRLSKRGVIFSNAYSASPLCSPTRASILTGQGPARTGITAPVCHQPEVEMKPTVMKKAPAGDKSIQCQSATRLGTDLPTLSKLIKANGYATAHFGKWHLGREPYSALQQGFDVDMPHWPGPGPAGSYVAPWKFDNFKENYPKEHIEDRMAEEATKWMRSVDKNHPFYLNYWMFSVHAPFNAKAELEDDYRAKIDTTEAQRSSTYAAMVHSMDDGIGTLLNEIDREGIADHTAIIFISDNGGNMYDHLKQTTKDGKEYTTSATSNSPLRGGKATMFEGGTRVPCIVVWPGLTKAGTRNEARIQTTDFYPTILNQLGIALPKNHVIDGVDMSAALEGKKYDRKPMFTYFPHAPKVPDWLPASVNVHDGDWKLIRMFYQGENGAHGYRLYNLKEDLGEKNNLAAKFPDRVKQMDKLIEDYLKSAKTVVPIPNPAFDPTKYHPELIGIQAGN